MIQCVKCGRTDGIRLQPHQTQLLIEKATTGLRIVINCYG